MVSHGRSSSPSSQSGPFTLTTIAISCCCMKCGLHKSKARESGTCSYRSRLAYIMPSSIRRTIPVGSKYMELVLPRTVKVVSFQVNDEGQIYIPSQLTDYSLRGVRIDECMVLL